MGLGQPSRLPRMGDHESRPYDLSRPASRR